MRLQDFDYFLPKEKIAQYPLPKRDDSRLMVLNRRLKTREDKGFSDFPGYLRTGDALVFNNTKVIPARLVGRKEKTGGRVECLLVERIHSSVYRVLSQSSRRLKAGNRILFPGSKLTAEVLEQREDCRLIRFNGISNPEKELRRISDIPLPPYLHRDSCKIDQERYQTVFAEVEGAVAAPTAGLHFTDRLLQAIIAQGIETIFVTLHVGPGTFLPVRDEEVIRHRMWEESLEVPASAADRLNRVRASGGRIFAVGTTVCRTLESVINAEGLFEPKRGKTALFITPGFWFRAVDGLITNFHLPKTTLLMLAAAFAGREWLLDSYREAVRLGYRFYSYGDAMLIV